MAKDPAFLFYPNDWLGGTMGMTFEEKGAYMELLMMQFNRGHMTTHMIGQTVGQLWDKIKDKFVVDENGLYFNQRLETEVQKRRNYCDSRRNNESGKNQYTGKSRSYDHTYDHEVTTHMTGHMENENEDVNNSNKGDARGEREPVIPYSKIQDLWNITVKDLPKIERMTDGRKKAIKARYAEGGLELFEKVFGKVVASDFLSGRSDKPWTGCGFDWVLTASNWTKIIEGNYDNDRHNGKQPVLPLFQQRGPQITPSKSKWEQFREEHNEV